MEPVKVYLEVGTKKVFAGAVDWPGWCRPAKDEALALQALIEYGPRYQRALERAGMQLAAPGDPAGLQIVERIQGGATTDFGAPEAVPSADWLPFDKDALERSTRILNACWQALADAVETVAGKPLRKGPRGGGRDLEQMIEHVNEAQAAYLRRLAWKNQSSGTDVFERMITLRQEIREALTGVQRNGMPESGPRGGKLWLPHYFVRRSAWHILDHAWEIEDRVEG